MKFYERNSVTNTHQHSIDTLSFTENLLQLLISLLYWEAGHVSGVSSVHQQQKKEKVNGGHKKPNTDVLTVLLMWCPSLQSSIKRIRKITW